MFDAWESRTLDSSISNGAPRTQKATSAQGPRSADAGCPGDGARKIAETSESKVPSKKKVSGFQTLLFEAV